LRLGGERRPERLRRRHWEGLAEEFCIATRAVFAELKQLTQAIEKTAEDFAGQIYRKFQIPQIPGTQYPLIESAREEGKTEVLQKEKKGSPIKKTPVN